MNAHAPFSSSSSPPLIHSNLSLSTKCQHDSVTLTARKVDLELLRLKGLGKVTKKTDTDDRKKSILTTEKYIDGKDNHDSKDIVIQQQQQQLEEYRHQLETSQQQVHTLKEELNIQYQQQEQQLQQEMTKHQTQLVQQEKLAHETIVDYMEKIELSQVNIQKLTLLVEKQDQLIGLLIDERQQQQYDKQRNQKSAENDMTADWHSLYLGKKQLDKAIGSLKANMETNQAHMQMMMMVSTEIQNDFEKQKTIMEYQLLEMANQLAAKDILLQQQISTNNTHTSLKQPLSPPSKISYRPIVNDAVILNSDIIPHPSLVSSSSSSRSSSSTLSSSRPSLSYSPPPHLHLTSSSPPPTIPLPPIPHQPNLPTLITISSKQQQSLPYPNYSNNQPQNDSSPMTSLNTISFGGPVKKGTVISQQQQQQPRTGSLDGTIQHGKPFWKSMKTKWRHS